MLDSSTHILPRSQLLETLGNEGRHLSTVTILFHSAIAERVGLNTTDHKCLDILSHTGPIAAGQLADMTGLTTGAITGVIDRLEAAGFVRRERDPNDRRRIIVQPLLEQAERKMGPLFESLGQAVAQVYSRYSDEELAVILDFIQRSIATMQEETAKLREGER